MYNPMLNQQMAQLDQEYAQRKANIMQSFYDQQQGGNWGRQSAQNDVGAANDKQASSLLSEIGKRLDRQDRTLEEILKKLEQLERRLDNA